VTRSADISIDKRNLGSAAGIANVTQTASVGRFVNDSGFIPEHATASHMYYENMRIPLSETSSFNANPNTLDGTDHNYTYWLTSSNYSYDSTQSLLVNNELQQTVDGYLIYPVANYTGSNIFNPNAPDYTDATGDRYWYRPFEITNCTDATQFVRFDIGVDSANPLTAADLWATNPGAGGVNYDSLDVRIRVKLPGPIGAGLQADSTPGTNWGLVTGGNGTGGTSPVSENWFQGALTGFYPHNVSTTTGGKTYNPGSGYVAIRFNFSTFRPFTTDNIALIEIRMKSTATGSQHKITKLDIEDWS
jgi:hypothetical protein